MVRACFTDCTDAEHTLQLSMQRIKKEYEKDKAKAEKEFEERLSELMETMLQECEEERRKAELESHNSDIASTPVADYPNKKSLRRCTSFFLPKLLGTWASC
ncbi:unnamed protein product [Gongylonema pulchrum]|uniref:RAB6-interacting golgin n=1 Tax=Gongylonema pulchrum TaxID=637853 RepID=A0A183DQT9_9BILA|nr:unnamed protein product [Gongylonema pulchrum]